MIVVALWGYAALEILGAGISLAGNSMSESEKVFNLILRSASACFFGYLAMHWGK